MLGEETVSVVVYANREIRQSLSAEDIVATADIKEMDTSTGLVPHHGNDSGIQRQI